MLPGKKSPSLTNAELGERDAEAEPRRADCGGVAGAKSKVSASSPTTTAMPHDEQKRPFLAMSVPQVAQVDMNLPKQSIASARQPPTALRAPSTVTPTAF